MSFVVNDFRSGFVFVLQLMIKFHIYLGFWLLVIFLRHWCSCSDSISCILLLLFHENQVVGSYGRNTIGEGNWSILNFLGFM